MSSKCRVAPLAVCLAVAACDEGTGAPPPQLRVNPSSATLAVGTTLALGAEVVGTRPSGATVAWRVVPDSIAVADAVSGDVVVLRGARAGAGRLVATLVAGGGVVAVASAPLGVTERVCTLASVVINPVVLSLSVGGEAVVRATVDPCPRYSGAVGFRSVDTTIATVDTTGRVRGRRAGTTTVLAFPREAPSASAAATVHVLAQSGGRESIVVQPSAVLLAAGDSVRLRARTAITPGADARVTFRSDDVDVATVDSAGLLRAVGVGVTLVRAIAVADTTLFTGVPVTVEPRVPFMAVSPASLALAVGDSAVLAVTVVRGPNRPAAPGEVPFRSRDPRVATVDARGVVRAVAPGATAVEVRRP